MGEEVGEGAGCIESVGRFVRSVPNSRVGGDFLDRVSFCLRGRTFWF